MADETSLREKLRLIRDSEPPGEPLGAQRVMDAYDKDNT